MAKNISFDSDGVPKQQPSVNQKRVDYSMPITGDKDFICMVCFRSETHHRCSTNNRNRCFLTINFRFYGWAFPT